MGSWVLVPCMTQWNGQSTLWACPQTEGDELGETHTHWLSTDPAKAREYITHHRPTDSVFERPSPSEVPPVDVYPRLS